MRDTLGSSLFRTFPLCFLLSACFGGLKDTAGDAAPGDDRPRRDDTETEDTARGTAEETGEDEPDPAEACSSEVEDWPSSWARLEEKVLELVNEERAAGANCHSMGSYDAVGPLEMDPSLRCAARFHAKWMAENDSMTHESPGGALGDDVWARVSNTDFAGTALGENIAAGYPSAASVVAGWMDSDGHCANIMMAQATWTGIGYYEGDGSYGQYWTQVFGM